MEETLRRSRSPGGVIRAYWMREGGNFGDLLTPLVLQHLGYQSSYVPHTTPGKLMGVGTLVPLLQPHDVVWGTGGYLRPGVTRIHPPIGVKFLAVRGPKTRSIIEGDVPEIYGDPGLLLPQFIPPASTKRYEVGVIPHMVEKDVMVPVSPNVLRIDITAGVRKVVEQITSCKVIVSSCLHGIITAEAYGIPTAWVRMSDKIRAGVFKFNDYYLATGREERTPVEWGRGLDIAVREIAPPLLFDPQSLTSALKGYFG